MTDRLDHVVIAVRDLDAAIARYDALGFAVNAGGRHVGRGTHNAIVRFGLDYLELISVYATAEATDPAPATLVRYLQTHEGGLAGYALATADDAALAARFRETGLAAEGPFAMARERPDGRRLSWRLLVPGGVNWRRPWPFFIQWDQSDAERLAWEVPGGHANGAREVQEVAVVVADLARGVELYARQIGLPLEERAAMPALGADSATLSVGAFRIVLLAPSGAGLVADALAADGEGLFQAALGVADLDATRRELAARGVALAPAPGMPGGLLIDPSTALGARLVLLAARA